MNRLHAAVLGVAGAVALGFLVRPLRTAQPAEVSITRAQALALANAEARKVGIDVDAAWPVVTFEPSNLLEEGLRGDVERRRRAAADPVLGPRLGNWVVTYFRKGLEKWPAYGLAGVTTRGEVTGAYRTARPEERGAKPAAEELRPEADRIAASRPFPGSPNPVFERVKPNVLPSRTDHAFHYRIQSPLTPAGVHNYLVLYFVGDRFAGWDALEEYADGRRYRFENADSISSNFLRFAVIYGLLALLGTLFLKKYHAGEVGIGIGAVVLGLTAALMLAFTSLIAPLSARGSGFGGLDARATTIAQAGFKTLFFDVPVALLVFLAWSVGESYARERWGEKLASFDALARRDLVNASVGDSLLVGLLVSPALAAAAHLPPALAVLSSRAHADLGFDSVMLLSVWGGPLVLVIAAATSAVFLGVVGLLFPLAATHRRKALRPLALLGVIVIGACFEAGSAPVGPVWMQLALSFGLPLAAAALFLRKDLLSAAVGIFAASVLTSTSPLLASSSGAARTGILVGVGVPLLGVAALAVAGLATRRTVSYRYEDLAPHVKRIVERERVKAEIDAANRIQAALLPPADPQFAGASVASHYGAATEIGGDYFDFLHLPNGRLGLAFGDVAGHGLTSGIVMAMAKSALLVQADYDHTPRRVLEVLNETVLKTAPKRMLMTFFFGVLDLPTGALSYASAGHLDPYVWRARTRSLESLSAWGFPLGVKRREPFAEQEVQLEPGDRLFLYSDGLIEALDDAGEPFGFTRFESVLSAEGRRSPEEIRRALLGAIRRFTNNRPPEDDQTLVVLAYDGVAVKAA